LIPLHPRILFFSTVSLFAALRNVFAHSFAVRRANTRLCDNPVTPQTNSVGLTAASRSGMVRNGDQMKRKCLVAAVQLITALSSASAQTYWSYGDHGPRARGYYGTPDDGGPQYGSGGDQYGYGPGYS
jgi:hypothetical protein